MIWSSVSTEWKAIYDINTPGPKKSSLIRAVDTRGRVTLVRMSNESNSSGIGKNPLAPLIKYEDTHRDSFRITIYYILFKNGFIYISIYYFHQPQFGFSHTGARRSITSCESASTWYQAHFTSYTNPSLFWVPKNFPNGRTPCSSFQKSFGTPCLSFQRFQKWVFKIAQL